ncbi:flippase [Corallibacter sp.]|uniref:flippase n=1 Tax=Corallibacter sp. TaxID=2038084 RepID=UPI003A946BD1
MLDNFQKKLPKESKKIIGNFLSLSTLQAANYILPLVVLPYMVRTLGAEKFGLVMFGQALIMLFKMAVDFGFVISGTREISLAINNYERKVKVFSAIMYIKLILTILGALILISIVESYSKFRDDRLVYYFSYGIVIGNALFPAWFFQGIEKMKYITIVNVTAKVIFTVCIFIVVKSEADYLYVPIFNSFGFIVSGLIGFLFSLKFVKLSLPDILLAKKLLVDTFSLFIAKFASNLYTSCNVLILGFFVDNSIVGVYSSMEKLILAIKNMYGPIYQSIFPWLVKQNDKKRIRTIKKMIPIIALLGVLITLFLVFFGNITLNLIYNNELITSYGLIFKILGFIAIFSGINMLFSNLYFTSIKKYKLRMNAFIITGIFNLILSFILVPILGITGTAISVTCSEMFLMFVCWYYYKDSIKAY